MDAQAGRDVFVEHVLGTVIFFPHLNSHDAQAGRSQLNASRHWRGHGDEKFVGLENDRVVRIKVKMMTMVIRRFMLLCNEST